MRTTINIDDNAHEIASLYASARGITLGEAIAELIKKSQTTASASRLKKGPHGLPVMPARERVVTSELVKSLAEEDDCA